MKYFTLLLTALLFFIDTPEASAQYGYGSPYGYGYPNPTGGVDRRIDRQRNLPRTKKKAAPEDKRDIVDLAVDYYTKELSLDGFQKAAMTKIYRENKELVESVANENTSFDVKKKKSEELAAMIDAKIIPLLSDEQAAKYKAIQAKQKQ